MCILFSVNYASGCSIAKFPEDGVVIAQTFKDQGTEFLFVFHVLLDVILSLLLSFHEKSLGKLGIHMGNLFIGRYRKRVI